MSKSKAHKTKAAKQVLTHVAPLLGSFAVAIMAAGKGTRLKSKHPKVLHAIAGKPLLSHVIAAATSMAPPSQVYAIIGYEAERVRQAVRDTGVNFVVQTEQRGTGHAIQCARRALEPFDSVLVLSGDAPLIRTETLMHFRDFHLQQGAVMSILTARLQDPSGYGRILRKPGSKAEVAAIIEQKALRGKQLKIQEINSGIYIFETQPLLERLDKLTTDNAHGEYYLTDMTRLLTHDRKKVVAYEVDDATEVLGINTRSELSAMDAWLRARKCAELMASGVTIFRAESCMIDAEVSVGEDTIIEPFTQILGKSCIGTDCHIGSYSVIRDSEIAAGVVLRPGCILTEARVASGAILGPYSHLRPGSQICEGAHVGNFVETKKTRLGKGAKANHLSYLGDAEIGANVNVGAGTITCNYDGVHKHTTMIEEGAFIGSDATLVAPVKIGAGAYVAAGSCITGEVPADALGIARSRQVNKLGWAQQRRAETAHKPK